MKNVVNNIRKRMKTATGAVMAMAILADNLAIPANACMDYSSIAQMIAAGTYHTAYIRSDGMVAAFGSNSDDRCDVERWGDVIAISAESHTVGLRVDGRVKATG